MALLRRFWKFVRSLTPLQWVYGFIGLVIALVLFLGLSYAWDYTNSAPFCGGACHTMPAHYESYQRSPHARVQCTECHIGRTFIGVAFTRKAVDAQFVFAYITGRYEYPIFAKGLQPAQESCEKCHWPEKFAWDKVVVLSDFQRDQKNTEIDTTLVLKTGGGTARTGLGRGIHWHIENPIEFKYKDELQQEIVYIQVTNPDGTKTIYTDIENPMTPDQFAKLPTRQMDCIDCHNRVSHTFFSPQQAMNTQLKNKIIDSSIPEIVSKGIDVLSPIYKSTDEANQAIANLAKFYQTNYASYYSQNTARVQKAIKTLQDLYPQIHYTDQHLDWNTHPDNLGHKDWPGCFRCHDGKHFTTDRKQAIRLECNICHEIPEVSTPGGPVPVVALASNTDEPESHKTTTWLIEHRSQFNTSCQVCHDTNNAGGKDNSSFCSNSACHSIKWQFAGFNAPQLADIIKSPIRPVSAPNTPPRNVPHPVGGNPDCLICHGPTAKIFPYPADHTNRPSSTCLACHKPTVPPAAATPATGTTAGGPPKIPHSTAGRTQCLGCHGTGAAGIPQITQFHKDFGFTNNNCLTCHKVASPSDATPTPAPTARPTAAPTVAPTAAPASSSSASSSASSASASTKASSSASSSASSTASSSASASSKASSAAGGPPPLPASHAGRTAGCTACHANSVGGAPKPLASVHAAFTDDSTCSICHK